ncbi:GMP synthase (glutamine-hydrolysing) [Isoptericola jiangsuensis]|uniref:GMP synthase (Glutamine-hydrolysing) n=1 Tax=Isoptericola jiangsuensis TaxID=548579 RepID=A0A2A9F042_9MICO|nr:type 1 glutamine amidotransferase [Isoptericola jiangsuensis]PFG44353.1 GMP synthase (glutamine-hydrolysing) [Isoptericola jiangsuensis]
MHETSPAAAPRITVLQHSSDVPLDRFGRLLGDVRLVRLHDGDPVPALDACGDGLVVLGGQMNAYADDVAPWLPAVRSLLARAVGAGLPTLGICLGAQLLAVAGGGSVAVAAPPGREAGVVGVRWRREAWDDPVLGAVARATGAQRPDDLEHPARTTPVVSMHADAVIEPPHGAQWLGFSDTYPYQAFRWGSALGVQFHPEASPSLAVRWALGHTDVDTAAVHAQVVEHDAALAVTGELLAAGFLDQVRAAVGPEATAA